MNGKVYLVGAGPGDPGLLTVKGKEVLLSAEVVVYDRLVGEPVLAMMPESAEKIDVGKKSANHPVPQHEINKILLQKALEGKRVVRLKGGDPYMFGRGGEELELLVENGIEFEVVPGVTSALSVPAYAGIPVTHRDFCSSLHIITGHAKAGAELTIDFEALKRTKGTLVFLMGVAAMPKICAGLLNAGMDPDMPAAVVERGTTPGQRKVVATLSTLVDEAGKAGIQSPAIIIVGKVCSLSDAFDWFDAQPLKGKKVVVTRPAERMGVITKKLRDLGADVTEDPCIKTVKRDPNPELDKAIADLDAYKWIVFTSPAGPGYFFEHLFASGKDARALFDKKIACIGPKTAETLAGFGIKADLIPEVFDSPHLAAAMKDAVAADEKVMMCRAAVGSSEVPDALSANGVTVDDIAAYHTLFECQEIACEKVKTLLKEAAFTGEKVYVTFTSASTVNGFIHSMPESTDFGSVIGCCIGHQTAAMCREAGISTVVSDKATIDSLVELIKSL